MVKPVNAMRPAPVFGLILAGGLSSRMGVEKALMLLGGQPVLAHVIARFQPQVARLALNANGDADRFAGFGLEIFADAAEFAGLGPLAGLAGGLELAARRGFARLACVPCDAPFLPGDLVARLGQADADVIAMATGPRGDEPLFALWPVALAGILREAIGRGQRGVHDFVTSQPHHRVSFVPENSASDPFLNLNRPEDARQAQDLLAQP